MFRAPTFLFFVAGLLGIALDASAATAPGIHIPDGFVDLTHGVPASAAGRLPRAMEDEAKNGTHLAYAVDLGHAQDGFIANLVASDNPGQMPDPSRIADANGPLIASLSKAYPAGSRLEIVSAKPVMIGDVQGARVALAVQVPAGPIRQVLYFLPHGNDTVTLSFTAADAVFAAYEPRFDAAAQATTGLEAPPRSGSLLATVLPAALSGIAISVATTIFKVRRKKKNTASASPAGPTGA